MKKVVKAEILNRIFNVGSHEWPRIILAWSISLLFRVGFIIGWTLLVAAFVNRMGINMLPALFVLNAVFTMLGALMYSQIIDKIGKELLMSLTIITAGAFLFAASLYSFTNNMFFLGLLLVGESLLLSQLYILISIFTEELFSPLEGVRALPIIESSETIGGIMAGIIVSMLSGIIPMYKIIYIWIFFIILIIPIIIGFKRYREKLPTIKLKADEKKDLEKHLKIKEGIKQAKKSTFLKGLTLIIVLQFMFINFLDFQYTKAIQQNVEHKYEQIETNGVSGEHEIRSINPIKSRANITKEEELVKELGFLIIIFSLASLLIQLLLSSRIIKQLGIVKSLAILPIINLLGVIGMSLRFGMDTAVIARGSHEMGKVIFQNSYHSSYYGVKKENRHHLKEYIEGVIKPVGAIVATIILFTLTGFFAEKFITMQINILLGVISLIVIVTIFKIAPEFAERTKAHLKRSFDLPTRLNAIELLGQRGNKDMISEFKKMLKRESENPKVKAKILEVFGYNQEIDALSDIVEQIDNENFMIRLAAVDAINNYSLIKEKLKHRGFAKHRLIESLKTAFYDEKSDLIRRRIAKILGKLDQEEIIGFLIKALDSDNDRVVGGSIYIIGQFNDASAIYYITPFLNHKNAYVRANAIIALWGFPQFRKQLITLLKQLLKSKKISRIRAGAYAAGEIKYRPNKKYLNQILHHENSKTRRTAALALLKMKFNYAMNNLADLMIKEDKEFVNKTRYLMKELPHKTQEEIENLIHQKVSGKIHRVLSKHESDTYEDMDNGLLQKLHDLYETAGAYDEMIKIQRLIKSTT